MISITFAPARHLWPFGATGAFYHQNRGPLEYRHPNGSALRRLTLKPGSSELEKKIRQLSPEKRSLLQQRLASKGTPDAAYVLTRRDPKQTRVLSFGQQQLWLVDQLTPRPRLTTYRMPCGFAGP